MRWEYDVNGGIVQRGGLFRNLMGRIKKMVIKECKLRALVPSFRLINDAHNNEHDGYFD